MIGLARSAMSRIGSHMAARRIEGCSLAPGELRCIRKMYGDRGADVVEIVGKDPARTLPLVLSRLQQKHDEWVAYRTDARKVWKKAFAEHRRPSLGREDTNAIPVEATADAGRGTLCPPAEAGEEASEQVGLKFFGRPISWWERAAQKGSFSPLESFQ
ncbi:hypothetical protein EUGRSUZ_F02735 [Eucalyptus grandis]|uniref:Uncharacterized protein n=2 Tax=Eucalyptus grandis TaxID=71139 RepID=A0ACC3KJ09_EUCGR|nr:hypothetical protein EUGRSUZ_F02735 [Eucalyptus grandis]